MAKWIADGSVICREVGGSRREGYNTLSGIPIFNVQLEIPNGQLLAARRKLLGEPEVWPYDVGLQSVRCQQFDTIYSGESATDADGQIKNYINPHIINLVYAPRPGVYITKEVAETSIEYDAYIEDMIEPRSESRPLNNNNFIWGNTTDSVPNNTSRTLSSSEAPSKYENGETLTHTVEGWIFDTAELDFYIGTCNSEPYTSPVLKRTFVSGTLLLKNIQVTHGFTFASYRAAMSLPLPPGVIDYSGISAPVLKFIYEYKKLGWERFFRYDGSQTQAPMGYYYIRYNESPFPKFQPFPLQNHSDWL